MNKKAHRVMICLVLSAWACLEKEALASSPFVRWFARISGEHIVSSSYQQGVGRFKNGWIFSDKDGLYRTDDRFQQTGKAEPAIPANLAAQGYFHIGDIDVDAEQHYLWAPIERQDKTHAQQIIARYDATTLKFVDSFTVPQHHSSFVTLDTAGVLYSADWFDDDTIVRYKLVSGKLSPLEPLKMSHKIVHIQGGDIADGALWLSTDDKNKGLYRVDLKSGDVQDLGSMGYLDGEGEGIDATPSGSGLLHVLNVEASHKTVHFIDAAIKSSSK